ncbi:MAG: UPF0149 family protein [Gammaproteobacteria bacterium]|nr:UPF0149 family protein [Gammaproteobacteria bacterium]
MLEDDELILSPLSQSVTRDGETVSVEIYTGGDDDWLLEVVDQYENSTVWNDQFKTDEEALAAFFSALEEDGIHAFVGSPEEELFQTDPNQELADTEMQLLDQFLLQRIDENENTDGKDEGIIDLSELDGFFTAIVSGPVMISPSQWLPAVWGDYEPDWESERQFETVMSLLIRYMNSIADLLMENPAQFEPLFFERDVDGQTTMIVDEWCEGYLRGRNLASHEWQNGGQEMHILLIPILAFTSATDWRGHDFGDPETENIQKAIAPNVREIHAFWLNQRAELLNSSQPLRRSEPRVGRNDPCPCGSGKKYKKCCLH